MSSRIDAAVGDIVSQFIKQSSKENLHNYAAENLQNAIKDLVQHEFEHDHESGFGVINCDNMSLYRGPMKFLGTIPEKPEEEESDFWVQERKRMLAEESWNTDSEFHGEIIVKVPKGHTITVKANEEHDTIISNIIGGEVVIRNVDTSLVLNMVKLRNNERIDEYVEMNIFGQAYIRDLTGNIKVRQFKGIVVIKTES